MKHASYSRSNSGFTLLELSIVLVIISIIIGSVTITKSMIRDAQLRSVAAESQRYIQAISAFRDKYLALPGDFSTASSYWGLANALLATCITTDSTKAITTCNGNGNGRIGDQASSYSYEEFRAWQHLVNAGMIEGPISGRGGAGGATQWHTRTPGTNIPKSKLESAGWGLTCLTANDVITNVAGVSTQIPYITGDQPPNHLLWLGGATMSGETTNRMENILTAQEAYNVDAKVDDGLPNFGKVVAQINTAAPRCTADSTLMNGDYDMTYATQMVCTLIFKTGF